MITTDEFKTLDDLYGYYNNTLFGGELPDCIVTIMTRQYWKIKGFFAAWRWKGKNDDGEDFVHEISLNPNILIMPQIEWNSTLVHEMCHLWQREFGKPSRGRYHNKEWTLKMIETGLIPSNTGREGGKMTGQNITHYIAMGGKFEQSFNKLSEEALEKLKLKYLPASIEEIWHTLLAKGVEYQPIPRPNKKTKYSCPCGNNVWGKPGLKIICGDCKEEYHEIYLKGNV